MIMHVLCVRDRKTDSYGAPFVALHVNGATRDFANAINDREDKSNKFAKNPEDYDLYLLGAYDDSSGGFQLLERPKMMAIGSDLVRQ